MSLKEKYTKEVVPALREKFSYPNVMAVPKMEKITVNVGVGRLRQDKEHEEVRKFIGLITGQHPQARAARIAIAAFKTRKGLVVGYRVTLRGARMYHFAERLIGTALPRTRDFQGIPATAFDKGGNLTIGIKECIVFPEMIGENYQFIFGLEATVTTTARTKDEGIELLKQMGFPIKM
ncbi:MAG: 50S ribosomal protein L5 [Patescibacteria group bacterium]